MTHLYRDHGIVLRTYKLGEADRIVVLITKDHGKVRAVAKGVRKTKSKFGSRLEPMSHIAVQFYEGRELDIVTQVESVDHFRPIRDDLDRIARCSAMLEAVDQMALEREPNPRLYQMLLGALRALAADNGPMVVPGFFWKLLALEGYSPMLDECVGCGAPGLAEDGFGDLGGVDALDGGVELVAFDIEGGGMRCVACRQGRAVSPGALHLMRQVLGGQLGAALATPESSATHEVDHLATEVMEHHLERRLQSVTLLDRA